MQARATWSRSKPAAVLVGTILLASALHWYGQAAAPASAQGRDKREPVMRGELVYVPIYSSIFYENGKQTLELAATLSIHNVNPDRPVTIVRADYHNTAGKLIRKYFEKPLTLGPLQTTNTVIDKSDTAGGTGANFLVEWHAPPDAASPLVEAVMINASSNLGIAFTTAGRTVRQTAPAP